MLLRDCSFLMLTRWLLAGSCAVAGTLTSQSLAADLAEAITCVMNVEVIDFTYYHQLIESGRQ